MKKRTVEHDGRNNDNHCRHKLAVDVFARHAEDVAEEQRSDLGGE